MGLMGWLGVPLDPFNTTTPILILAVAAGHAVQILKRYYEEFSRTGDAEGAVVESVVRVGGVMLAATLAQISLSIVAVFIGSKVAMAFGRDVRKDLFDRVTDFSADQGLAGWVISHRMPALIDNVLDDERWVQRPGAPSEHRSAIGVPLMIGEEALGAVLFFHRQPSHFSTAQLDLVQAIEIEPDDAAASDNPGELREGGNFKFLKGFRGKADG
jgi:GAF domain-containing protein